MRRKKALVIALIGIAVLLSQGFEILPMNAQKINMISVTYRFEKSEILNWLDTGQLMTNLRVMAIAGEPLTPYKVAKILLPSYTEVADVSVVGKVDGQYLVNDIPCGQPPAIIGEEPTIVGKNSDIYNSDNLYPREIYRVGSVESFRGYNILHVRLYPVVYTPASKLALCYKEMTVQVKLKEGSTTDTLRNLIDDCKAVETLVDNPSILSAYDSTLDTVDSTLIATETLGTTYEYIIVTTTDLADEFQVLADWKANFVDGAKVHNVSTDTSPTEIKNIINDYYANYSTTYVLLGGDVGVISNHSKYVELPYGEGAYIAEDYWFANLDGDDEISYYEVCIGRAPVDNETEATDFVNKVIAYEQMPKPKANLFHQSRTDHANVPDSRELAWQCEQYVPPDYVNYELFEENGKIEKTDWINFWRNNGIMCQHDGHGNETAYGLNYEVDGEVKWLHTDVSSMDNKFWPVHTSVACDSGAFEYEDCLAEAYVKDPDNGAIASLFNDKYGWYKHCDSTYFSGDFIEMQFKGLYQEGYENIGTMLAYSKHQFIDEATNTSDPDQSYWEWCWREINLLGDPETPLLTKRAQPVNIVKNSGWETGDNSFWNISITQEPDSFVLYEVNQDSACNGTYGFHVSMETDSNKPLYTTQSLMESQSLSHAMLDNLTQLKYRVYPAYELHRVSEIPQARWEIILSFSTGNKLHYYSSLNMEPTENSTDKYVSMPITLDQWNEFFDKKVLETYTSNFGTPPIGTIITKIAAFVTTETYAEKRNKFNRIIANFDSDEDAEGLQCTIWYVKNIDTSLNYTSIQEAIDAPETLDGHTISVMGPFYEHVVVNKSLTLVGKDPETTIIDGNGTGNVVTVQANNVSVSQFTMQNGKLGIYLEYSNYTSISGNTASNNSDIGIYLYRCINSSVSGNTASNNINPYGGSGIVIQNDISTKGNLSLNVGNNSVTGNIVSGSEHGIWLLLSNDNLISDNTVSNNSDYGIYVHRSRYNNITENHVSNNDYAGIYLYSSPYNNITENLVANNNVYGIRLYASLDNVIYHNNFVNNTNQASTLGNTNVWDDGYPSGGNYWNDYANVDQFRGPDQNITGSDWIWDSPYTIDANNVDMYPLVNPWTPTRTWTVDDNGPADFSTIQEAVNAASPGDTVYVYNGTYHEHITIDKFNLTLIGENRNATIIDGSGTGYVVSVQEFGKHTRISQFTIRNGGSGIYLLYSVRSVVSENTVANNNDYGIHLVCTMHTSVIGNTVSNNNKYGIYLWRSWCNDVSNNIVSKNSQNGIRVDNFLGPSAPPGLGENSISGNTVINNGDSIYSDCGIRIYHSTHNSISGNIVSNNTEYGIYLTRGYNTTIIENKISNNTDYGLVLSWNEDVAIYHNNFVNNTQQVSTDHYANTWDDDYPSGGNYWSDYTGQDQDGDGIGDTPYVIDENNQDNYPLMHPWRSIRNVDTGLIYLTIQKAIDAPETLAGHTIEVKADTYYEHVVVNKSLTIIGEDPNTTIIDGSGTGNVVTVQSDAVTISQFTIQNGKLGIYLEYSDGASISDNIVSGNWDCGMYLYNCVNSTVSGNTVTDNRYYVGGNGILIDNWQSNDSIGNNVVTDNIASGNSKNGIWVFHSDDNLIKNNIAKDNDDNGIYLYASRYNEIAENEVTNNGWRGINLYGSIDNVIHHNNFVDNLENAQCGYPYPNTWWDDSAEEGNYWSDYTGQDSDGDGIGDTPYVIDAGNQDNYPLMDPWEA